MKTFLDITTDLLNIESYSGNEQPVIDYILPILDELNFTYVVDDIGNIMATRGQAKLYPMLNAHMDSVRGFSRTTTSSWTSKDYRTLQEKAKGNYRAEGLIKTECLMCSKNTYKYKPSEYTCPKTCKVLKQIMDLVEEDEKDVDDKDKTCASCVYFVDCVGYGATHQELEIYAEMQVCQAYAPRDRVNKKKKEEKVKEFTLSFDSKTGKITSNEVRPMGGDDKCGIAIALQVASVTDVPMKILFTVQEEVGCVGVKHVVKHNKSFIDNVLHCITIDRRHGNELLLESAGHSNCSLQYAGELAKWAIINKINVKLETGSLADIIDIRPHIKEGVNISAGYYQPHSNSEYVNFYEMERIAGWVHDMMVKSIYAQIINRANRK